MSLRHVLALCSLFITELVPLSAGEAVSARTGPWGRLTVEPLFLEPPDAILENYPLPALQPRWCFPGRSAAGTEAFLVACGLPAELVKRLLSDPRAGPGEENTFTLFPSPADIEALAPDVRSTLYAELGRSPLNPFHHEPITIPGGDLDAWLAGTSLSADSAALIRKLAYHDADALRFSDLRTLLSHARDEAEARLFIKTVLRTRTLLVTLKVDGSDDLTALKRYWSVDNHRTDALPILTAAAKRPDGATLDIAHLLPPFARRLLHSYITPDLVTTGQVPNCHWTSLNFFNYTRQNIFMDLRIAASRLIGGYEVAAEPLRYGDMLVFIDADGNAPHTCIYLADDLVFTKNGANSVVPWVISRLADVRAVYGRTTARVVAYRRVWDS